MAEDERRLSASPATASGPYRAASGEDLSRILALSDGVFAFSMTLLIVNLTGLSFITCGSSCSDAQLANALGSNWQLFLGYATVFIVVALYWMSHHRVFRYIERYDEHLLWYNVLFLLTIAFLPFVLAMYNAYPDHVVSLTLASSSMAVSGLMIGAIWTHATGSGHLTDPRLDPRVVRYNRRRGLLLPLVFLLAIPVSLFAPAYAAYVWIAALPAGLAVRRYGAD